MAEKELVEKRGDYLYPLSNQFDIQRDNILLAKGSHFFCQGHLGAVVIEEQSRNPNYCTDCYRSIRE